MKNLRAGNSEAGTKQRGAVESSIPCVDHCPNTSDCQRWRGCDGGAYCRLCWRDFTSPKPVQVTGGGSDGYRYRLSRNDLPRM